MRPPTGVAGDGRANNRKFPKDMSIHYAHRQMHGQAAASLLQLLIAFKPADVGQRGNPHRYG